MSTTNLDLSALTETYQLTNGVSDFTEGMLNLPMVCKIY